MAASHLHRSTPDAALFRWIRSCETGIRELDLELCAVGGTYDAIVREGLLKHYPGLVRYPSGHNGGLVKLVAGIADSSPSREALDGIIYLVNPVDGSSLFPESIALRRQCVVHQKPFVSTVASAQDWIETERIAMGMRGNPNADRFHAFSEQGIALIAHDAMKASMLEFATTHFNLLCRFALRIATSTTGDILNELATRLGWSHETPWVTCYESGPMGGDAQIANRIFERSCQRVVFLENPHVAHQHEADIQLLERAVAATTYETVCITSAKPAFRWAESACLRVQLRDPT
nr:methylglyoxal synthase [Luteibacter sp. Sphag1AF]